MIFIELYYTAASSSAAASTARQPRPSPSTTLLTLLLLLYDSNVSTVYPILLGTMHSPMSAPVSDMSSLTYSFPISF